MLRRAGVASSPVRVAQAYLELAVLVRALETLTAAARFESEPDRSALWGDNVVLECDPPLKLSPTRSPRRARVVPG